MEEETMQELRSKAAELLLREEYKDSISAYSQFISLCQDFISEKNPDAAVLERLRKSLCLAFSNRAEARSRLMEVTEALEDCDLALRIERSHVKTLLCKGKILLSLNRYGMALECFEAANLEAQSYENVDLVSGLLEKCKRLDYLSRNGGFDISDWVLSGFTSKTPEFAEYVGAVEISKSEISGRGLFATKHVESGTLLLVTKAIAVDRAIMPPDSSENAQLVIWKNFIDKVVDSASKCSRIKGLISMLSTGEDEESLGIPDIGSFTDSDISSEKLDMERMLSILDVNSILEDAISAKVLGKNVDYQGVGLWVLASFINHSCDPNVRRLHIGDHVVVHASRDVKAGEELTYAYFDILLPINNRREMATTWGFSCRCKRCKFEENIFLKQDMRDIDMVFGKKVVDMGNVVFRLEEAMRRWAIRGKGKGHLRASFWQAYHQVFECEKSMKKWGRKIPLMNVVVDSLVEVVGSDERIVKVFMDGLKRGRFNGAVEMEKALKLGRGVYGKIMKKQALRSLLQFGSAQE
ncbi:hypothetical protein F511_14968 [Dorcoceras hygrometricum]|uniref:SET domain-containing protein n=1 Tax=Dorcoceras hygrometricum TaxID=472368 RepID=A0A2Z7DB81_9LAMI|nr:hypothetical protein F511_14968 [Dorcoceras hygrometricum]